MTFPKAIAALMCIVFVVGCGAEEPNYYEELLALSKGPQGHRKAVAFLSSLSPEEVVLFGRQAAQAGEKEKDSDRAAFGVFMAAGLAVRVVAEKGDEAEKQKLVDALLRDIKAPQQGLLWRAVAAKCVHMVATRDAYDVLKALLRDKAQPLFLRQVIAGSLKEVAYQLSWDFYTEQEAFMTEYRKRGVSLRECVHAARKAGVRNPYEDVLQDTVLLTCELAEDEEEDEEVRCEAFTRLYWPLQLCGSDEVLEQVGERLHNVMAKKETPTKIAFSCAYVLADVYCDERVENEVTRRLEAAQDLETREKGKTILGELRKCIERQDPSKKPVREAK